MATKSYIAASCIIASNAVTKNGESLFENKHTALGEFLISAYEHAGIYYPKFYKMDTLSKLGWLASEILLRNESVKEQFSPEQVSIVLSNANSSLDTDLKYYQTVGDMASPALFVYTLPNIMTGEICIRNGFKGENAFFISDDLDAALIEQYVTSVFASSLTEVCICGWVDVLEEAYKAVMFLVKKGHWQDGLLFTTDNIDILFKAAGV